MPRRKILTPPEEINYHLDCVLKNINKPKATRAPVGALISFLTAIAAKASVCDVELGETFHDLLALLRAGNRPSSRPGSGNSSDLTGEEKKDPLTTPMPTGILDGWGEDNE